MAEVPMITITGSTVPAAWESTNVQVWSYGMTEMLTGLGKPTKESSVLILIENPGEDPRIHKHFKDNISDLVVDLVEFFSPIFTTTCETSLKLLVEKPNTKVVYVNTELCHWSSRLKSMWLRLTDTMLSMNTHWTYQDGFIHAFNDLYVTTYLHRLLALKLSEQLDREITLGRYIAFVDSYYIPGDSFTEIANFLNWIKITKFNDRVLPEVFFKEITQLDLKL